MLYPITPEHWALFVAMLQEVATGTELTFAPEAVQTTFLLRNQGHFSTGGQSVATPLVADSAFNDDGNASGIHLLAMACGIPQGRPGFEAPTLALKIMDLRASPNRVLLAYDVFADGRRVLQCAGLQLDTLDEHSVYEPEWTFVDDLERDFNTRQELGLFCLRCIESFPAGPRAGEVRQKVFIELGNGLG